jgi:hypothetical protein
VRTRAPGADLVPHMIIVWELMPDRAIRSGRECYEPELEAGQARFGNAVI